MTATVPAHVMSSREMLSTLPGAEPRPEQDRLIDAIEAAEAADESLAAQAGTGTGKSFAACIPGIRRALRRGETVVIATATKNLQGQYAEKDLPFLAANLGVGFSFAMLKGKGAYACKAKLAAAEGPVADGLRNYFSDNPAHTGDFAAIPAEVLPEGASRDFTTTQDECPGRRDCPYGEECFAYLAKDRAGMAHILVVNHALLAMDLKLKIPETDDRGEPTGRWQSILLPEYRHVIIDEAHNFENYVTNILGSSLSQGTFRALGAEIASMTGDRNLPKQLLAAVDRMFDALGRDFRGAARQVELTVEKARTLESSFRVIDQELSNMWEAVSQLQLARGSKESAQRTRLVKKIRTAKDKVLVLNPDTPTSSAGEVVRWVQREERRSGEAVLTVGYSPLSVAGFLHERLWSEATGVLLSATLRPNDDPEFIPERLGMTNYADFDAGTPFDYGRQAGVFVPRDLNYKTDFGAWMNEGNRIIRETVKRLGGRAMLTFTSRENMKSRFDSLTELNPVTGEYEMGDFPCYMQQVGEPVERLIQIKKDNPEAIIFGLKSLMEGVDIPGNALQLVVIDKLTFDPPDDVVPAARGRKIDADLVARKPALKKPEFHPKGSFTGYKVPLMALLLEQAFGRAIRTKTDRAIIMILDNRLHPDTGTKYGINTFNNLPAARWLRTETELFGYAEKIARLTEAGKA